MPARQVDVILSEAELQAIGRKQSKCMRIDPRLLLPAQCVSQMGASSGAMFGTLERRAQAEAMMNTQATSGHGPPTVPLPAKAPRKDMTLADYAALFKKYYESGSLIDQFMRKHSKGVAATPEEDAALDREIRKRAARETRAKYLSGRLAGQYGAEVPGITPPPPAPPQLLGLTMVPKQGGMPKELMTNAQDAASAAKILEMASALVDLEAQRMASVEEAERVGQETRTKLVQRAAVQRPATAAFKATTRDHASRTGSRFVEPGRDAPGPGKYDIRYTLRDRPQPSPIIVPPDYKSEIQELQKRKAAQRAEQEQEERMARDAALMMGRTGGLRGTSEGGALLRGGASTAAMSTAALTHRSHYGAARPHTADAGALSAAGHNQRGGRSMGGAGKARRASAAAGGAAEAAALEAARLQLFKDAHQVHARPPPPQGTSSFKARPRPVLLHDTEASHLALHYWHEGIDSAARKSRHLVMPFTSQPPRPPLIAAADTPEALGPGVYIGQQNMPATWTGRHVDAGHPPIRNTPDFYRTSARPGSAKPAPLAASVSQLATPRGYSSSGAHAHRPASAPQGQAPIPPVPQWEAAAALQSLFGADLNPSDLISIQSLQALSGVDSRYASPAPSRPASAMRAATGLGRPASAPRPFSATSYQRAAAVAAASAGAATGAVRLTSGMQAAGRPASVVAAGTADTPGAGGAGSPVPSAAAGGAGASGVVSYLGPEEIARFSSTSLTGRVKGGQIPRTTREQDIKGLRVVADGKVIPPASAPLTKIRPSQAADVMYDPIEYTVQGHHTRPPAWQLPPNRVAMSKRWVSAAALAYL